MRARTLLSVLLLAAAVAGCDRQHVTTPDAPGAARRTNQSTGGTGGTSDAAAQGGYLGSGNKSDSTATEPVAPSSTQP
jgi:nitrous oxide reductase accessory protein NosL